MDTDVMPARSPSTRTPIGNTALLRLAHAFAARAMRLPTSAEYKIETPRQTLPESYCAGCIDDALDAELKKWAEDDRAHIYTTMSAGAEHDGRSHCHKCGLMLDCRLSEYGGEIELIRFSAIRFSRHRPPSDADLYHLWKMMESLAYHGDERKIALALRIGRRVLAALTWRED